jgi:hypothetical protein
MKKAPVAVAPAPTPTLSSAAASSSIPPRESAFVRWLPLLIFAVALFTRFYRLDCPPGVVFDESHFGRFTNQYTAGEYYFDVRCCAVFRRPHLRATARARLGAARRPPRPPLLRLRRSTRRWASSSFGRWAG